MAHSAGFCSGGSWASRLYSLHLLLTPTQALQRCWQDTDSLFAGIRDWQAQVGRAIDWRKQSAGGVVLHGSCLTR